jgi:ring-1,2-phenylacetyl-CoA epoxidase subunit PaaE
MKTLHLRIREIVEETSDSKSYYFDNQELVYKAGQFLSFILPGSAEKIRRAYSFCTSPSADKFPGITVKRVANGIGSRYILDNWQVGDVVECLPPAGKFCLNDDLEICPLLFAAGSGIVPIFSILKEFLFHRPDAKIFLNYSNQSPESTIFLDKLRNLQETYPGLNARFFFSNAFNIIDARMNGDYLDRFFKTGVPSESQPLHVFVCGPETYMYLCEVKAKFHGILKERFHSELYWRELSSQNPSHKFADGLFEVYLTQNNYSGVFQAPGNKTILRAAREAGIEMPWSCEGGRCSTCQIYLTAGEVYMSRNEVLTENELKKGLILTCTAYPTKGPISLRQNSAEA